MSRDPATLAECRALRRELGRFPSIAALRAAPDFPALQARFDALLGAPRRHAPGRDPAPSPDPARVRAVHWNIEHGNWYEQVEAALLTHPALADADVLLFNEIDLGMARAANRDVTADLCAALGRHGVWAPMFLETTAGRDDDPRMAAGRDNEEGLFGIAVLSRWPIGEVRLVPLPGPVEIQFDLERMYGRFVGLVCVIERPGAPFVAVSTHLEVHRTRAHRAEQVRVLLEALSGETRPALLAGDFNAHTFDRGLWHSPLSGGVSLLTWPGPALRARLLRPDRGPFRETLFDELRAHGFAWEPYVDFAPTLQVRFDRLDEVHALPAALRRAAAPLLRWAEGRGTLRLDWFAGRGWGDATAPAGAHGRTAHGLDGPGCASDHAPIAAEFVGV
jgi:endonuclease/exonuclease/phosphatase family metal-dependent hydrolase